MLNAICDLVSKIVSTGANGTILIIPLLFIIYALVGQARGLKRDIEKIFKGGGQVASRNNF